MGLKKRKKTFRCPLGLFDTEKKGTIILGCYRSGSHFVERAIQEHAASHGIEVLPTGETLPLDAEMVEVSSFFNEDAQYKTTIVNHISLKWMLINDPDLVQDYHIVRTTQRNIKRWFLSFYIMNNPDSSLGAKHPQASGHLRRKDSARINGRVVDVMINNDQAYYYDPEDGRYLGSWQRDKGHFVDAKLEHMSMDDLGRVIQAQMIPLAQNQFLQTYVPVQLSFNEIGQIFNQIIFSQLLSNLIPADQEIDYKDMASINHGQAQWRPENYLLDGVPWTRLFQNGQLLNDILDNWSEPPDGRLRKAHEPK